MALFWAIFSQTHRVSLLLNDMEGYCRGLEEVLFRYFRVQLSNVDIQITDGQNVDNRNKM
jgi:hypothetical protein